MSNNQAPCPICGHDIGLGDEGEWGAACVHLVADWAQDPGDNDGGVVGGSAWETPGIPAEDFARAIQSLSREFTECTDEQRAQKLASLKDILPADRTPRWWSSLCDALDDLEGEAIGTSNYDLGRIPTLLVDDVIFDVAGIEISSVNVTSGIPMAIDYELVWAEDPEAARSAIAACMSDATDAVRVAEETLTRRTLNPN